MRYPVILSNFQMKELIRDCFVTGKWKKSEDAEELLRLDDASDDDELYGDFEDLETGQKFSGKEDDKTKGKEADDKEADSDGGKG